MKSALNLLYLLLSFPGFSQGIVLVNQNVQGGQQNGTSWADAFTDLQQALAVSQYGDEIWVASGTYLPTNSNDRSISFRLKNGVKLFGGFEGTEISFSQRNLALHLTYLSGNIGALNMATDNSYHVLYGQGLDENTVIDGFIVREGYSKGNTNSPSDPYGAGLYLVGSSSIPDSRPVIKNCRFENNTAGFGGGGIYASYIDLEDQNQTQNLINPQISNCIFEANQALFSGGGLYKSGPTGAQDSFLLENVSFIKNYAQVSDGGGIYFEYAGPSKIVMKQVNFDSNTVLGGNGGGFSLPFFAPGDYKLDLVMDSCTFKKNIAPEGGGFFCDGRIYDQLNVVMNLKIQGCLFEENEAKNEAGGAFSISLSQNDSINVKIINSVFNRNYANSYFASAILCDDESSANTELENCTFTNNVFKADPSIYLAGFSAGGYRVNTKINNCLFAYNGAALFAGGPEDGQVKTQITNCTFFRNGDQAFGKRWHVAFIGNESLYFNRMNFYNCLIWEPGTNSDLFFNNSPTFYNNKDFFLDYCSFHPLNTFEIPGHELILGDSIFIGAYPEFVDTIAGDFRLKKCSPLLNRGDNQKVFEAGLGTDHDGNPRIRFQTVDLGAYETQDSCFIIASAEPTQNALLQASLSPNPVQPGEIIHIQTQNLKNKTLDWTIRDIYGRRLDAGRVLLGDQSDFSLAAPLIPGIYWVEMQSGLKSITLKFIVFQ